MIEKNFKKNLKVNTVDIKTISNNLKQKKLANIYSGKELSSIKKIEDGSNTVISLSLPYQQYFKY